MGIYRSENHQRDEERRYDRQTAWILTAVGLLCLIPVVALIVEVMS